MLTQAKYMDNETIPSGTRAPEIVIQLKIGTPKKLDESESSSSDSSKIENKADYATTDSTNVNVHGDIFRVEVYTENPLENDAKQNFQNFFVSQAGRLIKKLHDDVGLTSGVIESLCLSEESILGEIIFQIQREKGLKPEYTGQNSYYHTAGKTISYLDERGELKSIIVLNVNYFGAILAALAQDKPYIEWDVPQQLVYYLLAHECGHALDNLERKDISSDSMMTVDEFDTDKWSEHYAPLLFNEYLACVIASDAVTPALQTSFVEEWHNDAETHTTNLLRRRMSLNYDFREVMNCFWIVLVQLAKLLGHHKDGANFPMIKFREEFDDEERSKEHQSIIDDLDTTLVSFRENYPHIPTDQEITEKLTPIFERLAATYNFFFKDSDSSFDDDDDWDTKDS